MIDGKYHYFYTGQYVYSYLDKLSDHGKECTTGDIDPLLDELPPSSCGPGQNPGYINGKMKCFDQDTGEETNPYEEKPPQTTTTETTREVLPDGTIKDTTVTTYPDGSTKTDTTLTKPDGSSSGSSTTTGGMSSGNGSGGVGGGSGNGNGDDPLNDYCKLNPSAPICSEQGKASYSECSSFQCEGDPIGCAIGRVSWEHRCVNKWAEEPNDYSREMEKGLAQVDQKHELEEYNLADMFQEKNYVSGAQTCPSNITFNIFQKSMVIDLGWLCQYLKVISIMLNVSAWLLVGRLFAQGL